MNVFQADNFKKNLPQYQDEVFLSQRDRGAHQRPGLKVFLLPNLLTTGNLFCGFYAIILSLKGDFHRAAYAIVAAALFDQLDGRIARLTGATSYFGMEYDSLSDLVSFCVAPAILVYLWALEPFGRLGWLSAFFFVAAGALRLARFNVQVTRLEKGYFQGLPTPMAAGIIASGILAYRELGMISYRSFGWLILVWLVAFAMISTFPYKSFKDIEFRKRLPFKFLVLALLVLAFVAYWPEVHLFVLFVIYALSGLIWGVLNWGQKALTAGKKINQN